MNSATSFLRVEKGVFKIKHLFLVANIMVYLLSIEPLRGWNLRKHYKVEEINKLIEDHIINCFVV